MSTQTGSYNLKAAKNAHDEAKKVATDYLTDVDSAGVFVHPEGDSTTGWRISDAIELLKSGASYMKAWIDNNVPKIRIGEADRTNAVIDFHSFKLNDAEGSTYVHLSDLRDSSGTALLDETFSGDGSTKDFTVSHEIKSGTTPTVTVDGTAVASGFSVSGSTVTFTTAPASGKVVVVSYDTEDEVQAFTFGDRDTADAIGDRSFTVGTYNGAQGMNAFAQGVDNHTAGANAFASGALCEATGDRSHAEGFHTAALAPNSHAEGYDTTASGANSHAGGANCTASGSAAHASGVGTKASSKAQTALGKYNVEDANDEYAVIVGNGSDDDNRSNTLTVDWDGNVECGLVNEIMLDYGSTGAYSVSAGSYADKTITFTKTFSSPPRVIACFQTSSTAGGFGGCTLGVASVTTTGATIRVYNSDTATRMPNVYWIAIGS